jgi:hypothetical protein
MGLVGLFIGPVILAVTYRLFEAWAGLYVVPTPQSPAAPPAAAPPPAAPATALAADQVASQAPEAVVAAPAPAGTVPTSDPPR